MLPEIKSALVAGLYKDMDQDQWKELRRTGIGGSDVASVLGYSKYRGPLTLWMDKTGRAKPKDEDIAEENEAIAVGNWLEPFMREKVADYMAETMGLTVEVLYPGATYRSIDNPFMIYNPDGFLIVDGKLCLLEIKTGSSYVASQWGPDELPDAYYCQVQHGMEVLGLDTCYVFALIGNRRILRKVDYNEMFTEHMVNLERDFWETVKANDVLQAPLATENDSTAVMELSTPLKDVTADLTDHIFMIEEYTKIQDQIKDLEHAKDELKNRIIQAMGSCKTGVTGDYKVSLSIQGRDKYDMKQIKEAVPELVQQWTTRSEYPVLRIKNNRGKE